ncbi:MAG: YfhO family protein [Deltaproteobacteria bacterium]|nr:YfhO family protein [Deltaproteobacteria bacterium]
MRDWLWGLLLGLACVGFAFPSAVLGRQSLVPAAALAGDPAFRAGFPGTATHKSWDPSGILVHYPAELVAAREIRKGRLPLWNPHAGTGMPLLAEAHSAPLSPFWAPFWLAPSEATYSWALLLRLVVAVAAGHVLARRRGLGSMASALTALTYGVGGCAITRFDLPTEGTAYAMLPLCVLAADRVAARGVRAIPVFAAAVGLTIYSAHPELAALAGLGAVLFAASSRGSRPRAWMHLLIGLALGVGLGATVVVPLLDYLAFSGSTYKTSAPLAGMLVSDLKYFAAAPGFVRIGGAPLLLATLRLVGRLQDQPRGTSAARALVAVVGVGAALYLSEALAPGYYRMLVPPKYAMFLVVLAVALLAGEGLELVAAASPARFALATGISALTWVAMDALTSFRLHSEPGVVVGDVLGAAAVIAARASPRAATVARWMVPVAAAGAFLSSARQVVLPMTAAIPMPPVVHAIRDLAPAPARVAGLGNALFPNLATLLGSSDARAMAAIFPTRYRAYMTLVDGARWFPTFVLLSRPRAALLDLMGASLVITPQEPPSGWEVVARDSMVTLARNPDAAPRAFVPRGLTFALDAADSLAQLEQLAKSARLPDAAVVEAPIGVVPETSTGGEIRVVEYLPSRVALESEMKEPGLVVLTDTYHPGWIATVDGDESAVYPVDHLFRGVAVPAGKHRVVMTFEPPSLDLGLSLSACALMACLAMWLVPWRRER